jgi:phosphoenolpyruvate carboxykinase (GTP)
MKQKECEDMLRKRLDDENYGKLMDLENPKLHEFVADAIELCNPGSVFVCTDSADDIGYVREQAIALGEEQPLTVEGLHPKFTDTILPFAVMDHLFTYFVKS